MNDLKVRDLDVTLNLLGLEIHQTGGLQFSIGLGRDEALKVQHIIGKARVQIDAVDVCATDIQSPRSSHHQCRRPIDRSVDLRAGANGAFGVGRKIAGFEIDIGNCAAKVL